MGEFEWGALFGSVYVAILYSAGDLVARVVMGRKRARVFRKAMQHE